VSSLGKQMFFFGAATYNGHRNHYDKEWARDREGYDDVLVQGPPRAVLLARAITDWIGGHRRPDPARVVDSRGTETAGRS
jgi:hydroxyacyl-ACP dehydratase HTD2-like protein with hotdog domain